jgi:hypothetical protein
MNCNATLKGVSMLIILGALLLSFSQAAYAQEITIKGKVTDKKGALVSGDLHILLAKDSSLIKVDAFTDGVINIVGVPNGADLLVQVSAKGFMDNYVPVKVSSGISDYNLGTITLSDLVNLNEVTVTSRAPLFKRNTEGGTRVNVENTILASSVSANELLSRAPGIIVRTNSIQLFGRGEAVIYLNGKQIERERLASIPVASIKYVEIITNPSAKFDARGRGVINIVTSRNDTEGFQGQIIQNLTWARHFLTNNPVSLQYRHNKFSASADFVTTRGKDWNLSNFTSSATTPGIGTYRNTNRYIANTLLDFVSNYKIGMGYEFNKRTDISIQYDGVYSPFELDIQTNARNTTPADRVIGLRTQNDGYTLNRNHSANINFNHKLDTLGSTFFAGGQFSSFITRNLDDITEFTSIDGAAETKANRQNDSKNIISLFTFQADISKVLPKGKRLDAGIKFAHITNDSKIAFRTKNRITDPWVSFPQFSNSFLYTENVPAAYIQLNGDINPKWSYAVGLRSEWSIIHATSRQLDLNVVDTNYINLFPTVRVTHNINDNWSLSINYSRRINRPTYQSIDPFLWYQDSLTASEGNPRLRPELLHSFETILAFKAFSIKLGYAFSKDVIRGTLEQGRTGPNSFIFATQNLQKFRQFNGTLELPFESKYFSSYNSASFILNQFVDNRELYQSTKGRDAQFYFYLYEQVKLPKLFNIDINGEYTTANSDGLTERGPIYQLHAGISRYFLKDNRLFVRMMGNDIFNTFRFRGSRTFGPVSATFDQFANFSYFRASFTYKFGKLKNSIYKNKSVNDAEYKRIRQ